MYKRKTLKVLFGATIISSIVQLFNLGINLQSVVKLKKREDATSIALDDMYISVETSHPNYNKSRMPIILKTWVPLEKEQSVVKLKEIEDTTIITLDDVYIAVKTSHRNYKSRIPIILKTWVALAKEQTWFFTDDDDEEFQRMTDGHAINTKCPSSHSQYDLNCKMGVEINTYLTTNKTWFCHFDDDNYVNVPTLLDVLNDYDCQREWYLGKQSYKNGVKITVKEEKKEVKFRFGTGGAGICISRPLMIKMRPFTIDNRFMTIGESISRPDDVVVGYIIEHLVNSSFTEVQQFHSHLENQKPFKLETIEDQISLSYKGKNTIKIEGFDKKSDPTRFMSLHCAIYPKVDFCSEMKKSKIV